MANTTVNIASLSDLIFVVGEGEQKFRVNSHVLRNASPVFRVMFGPNFSEGIGLDYNHPKEVSLEEDDPFSIEMICRILHLKYDEPLKKLTTGELLKIARTIDKYSLEEVTSHITKKWLADVKMNSFLDHANFFKTSLILKNEPSFPEATV